MKLKPTSGDQEVADWYNQINQNILESGFSRVQSKWLVQLGGDTQVSKFIATHHGKLLVIAEPLLRMGISKNNLYFMEVLVSGLRKFMTQEQRLKLAEFLANEDRKFELVLIKEPEPELSGLTLSDAIERRKMIHELAKETLEIPVTFDYRTASNNSISNSR